MTAAIIQARMGSTRLPGKVLAEIDGKPLLQYQVERLRRSDLIDRIIIATSLLDKDDPIAAFCNRMGIDCFRGSETDCLDRYYACARQYGAATIVRLTADCPLVDPGVIDRMLRLYVELQIDYMGNTIPPEKSRYPDGSDVEIFSMSALERTHKEAVLPQDREHVTFYMWKNNDKFRTYCLDNEHDWSRYRFTVDYPEDFEVVEFIIRELEKRNSFGHLREIIDILDANPAIFAKNANYYFGIGWK